MTQKFRLPEGGRVDRTKPLSFSFNGEDLKGYAGDSLASALIANGRHLVARSFKYHRPRGILTAGVEEPNALVQLGRGATTMPNLKATEIPLFDGLEANSVNCWPSVAFDANAVIGWASRLLPAGFYYKTFMPSLTLWHRVFEPIIRHSAGWGRAPEEPDPDCYDHKHVHCDVLIVGGGPAGLAAAVAAGRIGARVVLTDEQTEFGGSLLSLKRKIDGDSAQDWINAQTGELAKFPEIRLLPRTTVFGYYDQNYLVAAERRVEHDGLPTGPSNPRMRLWHIRAGQVILATGAHERPLVFPDNDRPGTMLASAAQSYVNRYGVQPGSRAVLFTNNDNAYEAALDVNDAGLKVAAIIDIRSEADHELCRRARDAGIDTLTSSAVTRVKGRKRLHGVQVRQLSDDRASVTDPVQNIRCDLLMMSGGWSPVVHLYCHAQGKLSFNDEQVCFVPGVTPDALHCTGALTGIFGLSESLRQGSEAGRAAAKAAGYSADTKPASKHAVEEPDGGTVEALWAVPAEAGAKPYGKAFVDFQNDTTSADIRLATQEGFSSVEHMKRYTLSGFGTDQGKTGNINALAILSDTLGSTIPQTGTTTFRPPYTPVPFGAMAGRDVGEMSDPVRTTAMHDWHVENGAIFEDVGQWKRPWYYPRAGEDMQRAVDRECLAVRCGVGIVDASTLGKIDLQGPDVAEFLNRIYTNSWTNLKVGRVRYGLMCHEDGMVFDDGTTARLGENHFLMTTTTGGAAGVFGWLEEYLQTEWPDLKVYCTSVTEQWATLSISGPEARNVLEKVCPDIDLSASAFPFMSVKTGTVAGVPACIFRISFTGELAYEINVPSWHGQHVWDALMTAGHEYEITPYGTEAMHVLRAEKGFFIAGQETDGSVTPHDLGLDWLVSKKKANFIGKRSFRRSDTSRSDRKQLVGIRTDGPKTVLPEGAQLVADPDVPKPVAMLGHVTSSYHSAHLGHSIALALVESGRARMGESIYAPLENQTVKARIVEPIFYDRQGERRDG